MKRTTKRTLKTAALLVSNKLSLWAVTASVYLLWLALPEAVPFASVIYGVLVALSIASGMPVVRFLLFPEAAEFAETGELRKVMDGSTITMDYIQYRFATTASLAMTGLSLLFIAAK
jgi:hypothetical protein